MSEENQELFSDVRINLFERDNLRGFASCKVADVMYVNSLRIVDGKDGLFVAFPSRKKKDGKYKDIYFTSSKELKDQLSDVILAEYEKVLEADEHNRDRDNGESNDTE